MDQQIDPYNATLLHISFDPTKTDRYIMVYVELVNFLFFSPRISHLDPP